MLRRHPALFFLAFVVAGIVLADLSRMAAAWFLFLALAAFPAAAFAAIRSTTSASILFGASLTFISAYHFARSYYDLGPAHVMRLTDETRTVQIFGRVADWPDLKSYQTELKVEVDSLGGSIERRTGGFILIKVADTTTALQRGDRIEFWARIYPAIGSETGDERFDYRRYLNLKGVFGIVYLPTLLDVRIDKRYSHGLFAAVDRLRDWIRATFYRCLSPTAAALAGGFLIGETRDIPPHLYQWFRDSGTLHLLAVSGSNVALVLLVISYALRPFGFSRRAKSAALLVVIVAFGLLSYGEPSVIRASVMAALVILARLLERRYDLNQIIAASMLIILLWDPAQLYDVGFQLSFATAWGLIFLVPKITPLFERHHNRTWYRFVAFPVIISLVAQLFSTPITLLYFGRFPIWTLPANLIIVPLVSLAVIGVLVLLAASLMLPILGQAVGVLLDGLMQLLTSVVGFFGGGSRAVIQLDLLQNSKWGWLVAAVAYVALVIGGFAISHRRARRLAVGLALLALNIALLCWVLAGHEAGVPKMSVCRVPGGVGILCQNGRDDLVLSGLEGREYEVDERVIGPWLESSKVDSLRYIIALRATYPAIDDLLRLAVRYRADSIYLPDSYRPAVHDAKVELLPEAFPPTRVSYFGSGISRISRDGYFPSAGEVVIRIAGQTVVLLDADSLTHARNDLPGKAIVVIGRTWRPSLRDLELLRASSAHAAICARVAQVRLGQWGPITDSTAGDDTHCPIYNLSRQGELQIRFSEPIRISDH